ncbi:g u mismatch-specific uracil dna glycosylase [Colletotrichum truncatum]|uniref:G u mismatch-specific uracil dna glycosylase n=1 Tax=Colletotrichum truncatum TaxID=5467 RepID=A0ACC3YTI6_COLTU|nr:g u mismatch-specific uracil dna glycosylase [Colletotrichum truncatum]KAF6798434.1 g u mismatch-specific uracil dna glycosylase [Colletotrichum truncatum]
MESPFFDGAEPQLRKTASFQGRLHLQEFMFKPTSSEASPTSQTPSPLPLRRSPRKLTPLGPLASPDRVTKTRSTTAAKPNTSLKLSASASPSGDDSATGSKNKSKPKRKRQASGYAPPSTYAHLPPLQDILAPNLLILFVGLNPGLQTARAGHAYAHPSNLFWKLLYSSGITTRLCSPTEDRELPRLYALGNTNIVSRPSRNGSELSKAEMDDGVEILEEKVRGCRPETVCIVGKSIWESIWRVRHGRAIKKEEFRYGWQDEEENMGVIKVANGEEGWAGAKVFVATSTSGLAATLRPAEKEKIWRELGEWCEMRRVERNVTV